MAVYIKLTNPNESPYYTNIKITSQSGVELYYFFDGKKLGLKYKTINEKMLGWGKDQAEFELQEYSGQDKNLEQYILNRLSLEEIAQSPNLRDRYKNKGFLIGTSKKHSNKRIHYPERYLPVGTNMYLNG